MIPLVDILVTLKWLLALYGCMVAGSILLINGKQFSAIRYAMGKAIGVIGFGLITWVLSILRIVPFTIWNTWVIVSAILILLIIVRFKTIKIFLRRNWRQIALLETVFMGLFIVGIILRASNPRIEGIEKFMDSAILSNLLRHTNGVPVDTWYAPDNINYYYFGHWLIALVAKLSHTAINWAFNLGLATTLAISGTTLFAIGWQISQRLYGGLLAVFLTFFASNLHPVITTLGGQQNYFFYNSGRFIEQVINEYPLYSLILGDLHAHMLALIISTTLYAVMALIIIEQPIIKNLSILIALAGILCGLLIGANSFDIFSSCLVLGLVAVWLYQKRTISLKTLLKLFIVFISSFMTVALIFLSHFRPGVGGIGIALFKTPILHYIWQFGLPVAMLAVAWNILYKHKKWQLLASRRFIIGIIFGLAGLVLILLPNIVFLKDIYFYQNPPFARANTVFKIWYAAWPLISLAVAILIVSSVRYLKKNVQKVYIGGIIASCLILSWGLYFGLKTLNDNQPNTLNGLAYLTSEDPQKLSTLGWVSDNIKGQPLVIQAAGDSYSQKSWFSSYSGLPSTLGWASHEWGWRYSEGRWNQIAYRMSEIKALYESISAEQMSQKAHQLGVDYILLGPDELNAYQIDRQVVNEAFGNPVYGNGRYAIYSTRKTKQ